jgi:hypothetical protein
MRRAVRNPSGSKAESDDEAPAAKTQTVVRSALPARIAVLFVSTPNQPMRLPPAAKAMAVELTVSAGAACATVSESVDIFLSRVYSSIDLQ